jgi:hypothetical protein
MRKPMWATGVPPTKTGRQIAEDHSMPLPRQQTDDHTHAPVTHRRRVPPRSHAGGREP